MRCTRPRRARPRDAPGHRRSLTGPGGVPIVPPRRVRSVRQAPRAEQQRIQWAALYAKLQVSVPAGEGPDLCLIHTVEVPHFANDGILEAMDDWRVAAKGFRGEDYIPATWQGGMFQGKRYAIALDVPQHLLYLHVGVMRQAGLVGADGKPKV